MKHKLFTSVLFGICLTMFTACQADVDLDNLDATVGAKMGLALPVGEMSMTIGDFLGNGSISEYLHINEDGMFFFEDTFSISRRFAQVHLEDYFATVRIDCPLPELSIPAIPDIPIPGVPEIPDTYRDTLRFPLPLQFLFINDPATAYERRIDSIAAHKAEFISHFTIKNSDLPADAIERIELVLDEKHFHFKNSPQHSIALLPEGQNYNYGENLPITIDEFTLSFLKDPSLPATPNNVGQEIELELVIYLAIDTKNGLEIHEGAAIDYNIDMNFLDYEAVWGVFDPHNEMRDEDTVYIADQLPGWENFIDMRLPFAAPEINIFVSHSVSGPLRLHGDYLFAHSTQTNETRYLTFEGGSHSKNFPFINVLSPNAPYDAMVENLFQLNKEEGHLENLFTILPDQIGFCFDIRLDQDSFNLASGTYEYTLDGEKYTNYRLSENLMVDLDAVFHMPLDFNEGVQLNYNDTSASFAITNLDLDSLLNGTVDSLSAQLKLMIQASNSIPFDIDAEIEFLNEQGNKLDITIIEDTTQHSPNILHIEGPAKEDIQNGIVTTPAISTFVINIDEEQFSKLSHIDKVVYKLYLGDNKDYVCILRDSSLKLKIALAADIEAVMDLGGLFQE